MSYEPLGAQAEKSRRQKLCKNRPTGTDRCIIHITKKQERKTTKKRHKQVPHPHQPLLLVEKGEKAIEKYLTESNCRNGKQITDHIILERNFT